MFVLILKPQSNTRVIACVFFSTNHTCIHQWSLHVCSFHKTHMDQPLVIACVLFPQTTHGSTTRVIECVLFRQPNLDQPLESLHVCYFPQTTHGSTSGHCMCVLSTNHIWINQSHCMCFLSTNHTWINH